MDNGRIIDYIVSNEKIQDAFQTIILMKYEYDGYFNTSVYYSVVISKKITSVESEFKKILKSNRGSDHIIRRVLSLVILGHIGKPLEVRALAITSFIREYIDYMTGENPEIDDAYILNTMIKINRVTSICDYFNLLDEINYDKKNSEIFFRGHDNINYILLPSILRNENWYSKEQFFYNSVTRMCPKDFTGMEYHVDRLVEMQHYELPTRLLDITKNALVALLFSCLDDFSLDKDGEIIIFKEDNNNIKYGQSDTITILSCFPCFTRKEQEEILAVSNLYLKNREEFNEQPIIKRLLHEIKTEKPAFKDEINPEDISKTILALPSLLNNRIIKQSGAFIITGLEEYQNSYNISKKLNSLRFNEDGKMPICIVEAKSKRNIRNQLELCDINEATIFPEIDRVARYLKKTI